MSFFSSKSETHAVTLLKQDHREVEELFRQWSEADDDRKATAIVTRIAQALTIHAEIEESLVYPRALNALDEKDADLVREAAVEHGSLKGLIAVIDGTRPRDAMFCAQVTVLKEYVQHHVREEENELFPKLERTDIDLEALGLEIQGMKEELEAEVARSGVAGKQGVVDVVPVRAGRAGRSDSAGRGRTA